MFGLGRDLHRPADGPYLYNWTALHPDRENCQGDNLDAAYQINGPYPLDNGVVYAVAGTLVTETGNATYVGLGINHGEKFLGVANLSDKDLKGTAKRYRGEVSHTGNF